MFKPILRQELVNVSYPFIPVIQEEGICFGYYNFKDEYLLCKLSYHGTECEWEVRSQHVYGCKTLEEAVLRLYKIKVAEMGEI